MGRILGNRIPLSCSFLINAHVKSFLSQLLFRVAKSDFTRNDGHWSTGTGPSVILMRKGCSLPATSCPLGPFLSPAPPDRQRYFDRNELPFISTRSDVPQKIGAQDVVFSRCEEWASRLAQIRIKDFLALHKAQLSVQICAIIR